MTKTIKFQDRYRSYTQAIEILVKNAQLANDNEICVDPFSAELVGKLFDFTTKLVLADVDRYIQESNDGA